MIIPEITPAEKSAWGQHLGRFTRRALDLLIADEEIAREMFRRFIGELRNQQKKEEV